MCSECDDDTCEYVLYGDVEVCCACNPAINEDVSKWCHSCYLAYLDYLNSF